MGRPGTVGGEFARAEIGGAFCEGGAVRGERAEEEERDGEEGEGDQGEAEDGERVAQDEAAGCNRGAVDFGQHDGGIGCGAVVSV